jgi:DNA primase
MDFLKLYQSTIHPVVSVSGTAFTSRHASSIAKITQKVILLYDGDEAGGNAAIRAGWVLYRSGLIPGVVRPPIGLDPDDWIDHSGSSELLSAIDSPIDYIDFHMNLYKGSELKGTDRQQYIMNLAREIKGIEDGVIRNDLIKAISEKLSIEEHDLIRTVNTQRVNPEQNYEDDFANEGKIVFSSQVEKAQVEILQLMIGNDIELKRRIVDQTKLELFTNPLLNQLAKILFDKNLDVESSSIIEYFQDKNERDSIAQILFTKDQNSSSEEIVSDCIKILKSDPIKEKISALRIEIREKESKGENPAKELDVITKLRLQLNDL